MHLQEYKKETNEDFAGCDHACTSNCRREGCNCNCGEFHDEELCKQYEEMMQEAKRLINNDKAND